MAVACVSDRFLRACRRQPVDLTPVWFMRQAGRYMPQYRAVRARHGLLEICQNPERAAEVTITAAEELGVDAAIIFADLLLPALPLGFHLHFNSGEGPVIEPVLRDRAAIARLPESLHGELGYVSEAIRRVAGHFPDTFPVIGFAGAPFTLASYLIEGGASRQFAHTKRIIFEDRGAWALLMQKLCPMLVEYLSEQVEAGARNAREVADRLPWTRRRRRFQDLDPFNQMLAVFESELHLQLLAERGRLRRDLADSSIRYALP